MPDEPATPPTATTEHVANVGAADAVEMQLRAQKHRLVADHLEAEGDLVAPRFERAEARRLEREAELALDPVVHATGPVTVGNGGEMAIGTKAMRPFVDTVRERPDMLAVDASRERMELAEKAERADARHRRRGYDRGREQPGEDAGAPDGRCTRYGHGGASRGARTAHTYKRTGYMHQSLSIEAGRLLNASARMMESYQQRHADDPEGPQRWAAGRCGAACQRRRWRSRRWSLAR